MYPQKLYEFWATLPEPKKKEQHLEMDTKTAHQMFHRYYNTRLKCLWDHCCKQKGTKTYEWKVMFEHWKDIYPDTEKKDKDLAFETEDNARNMIRSWMELLLKEERDKREQWKAEQVKQKAEHAKKEEIRKKKMEEKLKVSDKDTEPKTDGKGNLLSEKEKKKAMQKQAMEKLAVPKDRLIRGKTVVQLRSIFTNDKILNKMLVSEFENDRMVKRPLEYDYVDSEEEDRIKMRENKGKRSKSDGKEEKKKGEATWMTSTAKEAKRADELKKRFEILSQKYNSEKMSQNQVFNKNKSKHEEERKQFDELMMKEAQKYRQNILSKNNQSVPSENKFLSEVILSHQAL